MFQPMTETNISAYFLILKQRWSSMSCHQDIKMCYRPIFIAFLLMKEKMLNICHPICGYPTTTYQKYSYPILSGQLTDSTSLWSFQKNLIQSDVKQWKNMHLLKMPIRKKKQKENWNLMKKQSIEKHVSTITPLKNSAGFSIKLILIF